MRPCEAGPVVRLRIGFGLRLVPLRWLEHGAHGLMDEVP